MERLVGVVPVEDLLITTKGEFNQLLELSITRAKEAIKQHHACQRGHAPNKRLGACSRTDGRSGALDEHHLQLAHQGWETPLLCLDWRD